MESNVLCASTMKTLEDRGSNNYTDKLNNTIRDRENVEKEANEAVLTFSKLPPKEKCVIVLCALVTFIAGCAFSLPVPVYPTFIGFVFGVFELVIFLFSPIIGNYLSTIGPKFVQISGVFIAGVSVILFGALDKCPSGLPFIVISILVRSAKALGCAGFVTSTYAIISNEFPDFIGTVYGILETGNGVGFMIGPSIGGALYELGGFGLPFYVTGVFALLIGVLLYNILPRPQDVGRKRIGSILSLLRIPKIIVLMGSVFLGGFGVGALDSTFALHMESLGVSSGVVALYFMIGTVFFAVMAPFLGFLVDTKHIRGPIVVLGHICYGLAFVISGPSFILPFLQNSIWTLLVGLSLAGMSLGCCYVPTMSGMAEGVVEAGYNNDLDTLALVSGLFTSAKSIGAFAGPLAGGSMVEQYGYRVAYSVVGLLHILWAAVPALFFGFEYLKRRKNSSSYENFHH